MSSINETRPSKKMIWSGRVVSALPILLILFGSVVKLAHIAPVVEGFKKSGYPENLIFFVGLIELIGSIVYLIPRTSVLGAVLLTGLLGGAVATNLRIGDATYVMPAILGRLVWLGLFLRNTQLRSLIAAGS